MRLLQPSDWLLPPFFVSKWCRSTATASRFPPEFVNSLPSS